MVTYLLVLLCQFIFLIVFFLFLFFYHPFLSHIYLFLIYNLFYSFVLFFSKGETSDEHQPPSERATLRHQPDAPRQEIRRLSRLRQLKQPQKTLSPLLFSSLRLCQLSLSVSFFSVSLSRLLYSLSFRVCVYFFVLSLPTVSPLENTITTAFSIIVLFPSFSLPTFLLLDNGKKLYRSPFFSKLSTSFIHPFSS